MATCLGIYRELTNSPNRESDDKLVLDAVLEQLGLLGFEGRTILPHTLEPSDFKGVELALPMCESYPRLMRLKSLEREGACLFVNSPTAVLDCYRTRMVPVLEGVLQDHFPKSEIRSASETGSPPEFMDGRGLWIKRGDVHNTCDRDVVRILKWSEVREVLRDFRQREITHLVLQEHLDGDLIKFYGVGPGQWFTWFYHDPPQVRRHPFTLDDLAYEANRGACALGLRIFGGDAIVAPSGKIYILDLNSWPSFARVRREAAVQIAWYLQSRILSRRTNPGGTSKPS